MRAQALLALKKKQTAEPEARQVRLDWEPLPKQKLALETPAFETLYGGAAGGGKLLDIATEIATPDGWTTMGALRTGDRVFDERGQICTVVQAFPIVQPEQCYRLTFDDGAVILAGAEHKWLTFDAQELAALTRRDPEWQAARRAKRPSRSAIGKGQKMHHTAEHRQRLSDFTSARNRSHPPETLPPPNGTLRTTQQIAETLRTSSGRANHAIPVSAPLELPTRALEVDPYVLGVWLGDGSKYSGSMTGIDPEIWQECERAGFTVTHSANSEAHYIRKLAASLRALGVLRHKHIPSDYLWADYNQRLALLQGLMDTDGGVCNGSAEFTNTNRDLAAGVAQLVRSLGMKANLREGRAKLYTKDCGPKWTVKFRANCQVFRLPRKVTKLKLATRRTTRFRYIANCERIDPIPMRCIAVDSPSHLYLAGRDLIPTHNSDLIVALARLYHRKSLLLRRAFPDLERSLILRSLELYGLRERYNAGKHVWTFPDTQQRIEFGHVKDDKAVYDYQSAEYDLIGFDEVTQFSLFQYRYLLSRLRSTYPGQRVRIIACTNPGNEGNDWVMERWAAWLDEGHPNPAQPGELRWFKPGADDKELETTADDPEALSRTFIPASLDDNPHLPDAYRKQLNALPEPWRSQLKDGKWSLGLFDDPYQIVPTAWIRAAQARWRPDGRTGFLTNLGVDPARGGDDKTILASRYGAWLAPLSKTDGRLTTTGYSVVQLMLPLMNRGGSATIDVIGIGSAVIDAAQEYKLNVHALNVSSPTSKTVQLDDKARASKVNELRFVNERAYWYWKLREALDPEKDILLALPPDPELLGELRATKWKMGVRGIQIIDKDDIKAAIGRSPNCADAVMLSIYQPELPRGGVGRVF